MTRGNARIYHLSCSDYLLSYVRNQRIFTPPNCDIGLDHLEGYNPSCIADILAAQLLSNGCTWPSNSMPRQQGQIVIPADPNVRGFLLRFVSQLDPSAVHGLSLAPTIVSVEFISGPALCTTRPMKYAVWFPG